MVWHPLVLAAFSFGGNNELGNCFYWGFAGVIAGTVATFVARGRLGCVVGNFFLGVLGAAAAWFILNLFFKNSDLSTDFIGTTVIASVAATIIALLVTQALRAEHRHQQHLLDKYHAEQHGEPPQS